MKKRIGFQRGRERSVSLSLSLSLSGRVVVCVYPNQTRVHKRGETRTPVVVLRLGAASACSRARLRSKRASGDRASQRPTRARRRRPFFTRVSLCARVSLLKLSVSSFLRLRCLVAIDTCFEEEKKEKKSRDPRVFSSSLDRPHVRTASCPPFLNSTEAYYSKSRVRWDVGAFRPPARAPRARDRPRAVRGPPPDARDLITLAVCERVSFRLLERARGSSCDPCGARD